MKTDTIRSAVRLLAIALATSGLGGCALFPAVHTAQVTNERECLARAMYFESNRSSDDGMLAVGTVVMNRRESGRYPYSICGVVGQRVQFAPGVLSKQMNDAGRARAFRVADQVMAGKRYPGMQGVYFFHTAGYTYPYSNMHYVAVAGGNAFYEKRHSPGSQPAEAPTMIAQADPMPAPEPAPAPVRQARRYVKPIAAQPLPPVVADNMDGDGRDDALLPLRRSASKRLHGHQSQIAMNDGDGDAGALPPLPPVRNRATTSKRSRALQTQFAENGGDDAGFQPQALPPVRSRATTSKRSRVAQTQFAENGGDDAGFQPEALPPVRPRGSVGEAHIGELPRRSRMPEAERPAGPQFRFEQGPAGIEQHSSEREPAKKQRPRTVVASQSRAVPTVRIGSVPIEADMTGLSAPAGMPKSTRPRSALEPQPLY